MRECMRFCQMTCQLIKLEFLVPTAISQHQEQTPVYTMSNSKSPVTSNECLVFLTKY